MRACRCDFIVQLEDDVCVHGKPRTLPRGSVGGLPRPDWETVKHGDWFPQLLRFLDLQGAATARPPDGWIWGCAGGCAYRTSSLAHLPEFGFARSQAWWHLKAGGGMLSHAVDMVGPAIAYG